MHHEALPPAGSRFLGCSCNCWWDQLSSSPPPLTGTKGEKAARDSSLALAKGITPADPRDVPSDRNDDVLI